MNALAVSPVHADLMAAAGEDGIVECFDLRMRKSAGKIFPSIDARVLEDGAGGRSNGTGVAECTAVTLDRDGLTLAAGTSEGDVLLYDLRRERPLQRKSHNYGLPIKRIAFHRRGGDDDAGAAGGATVMSADKKVIKLWSAATGRDVTTIEGSADINDFCLVPAGIGGGGGEGLGFAGDSGLLLVPSEQPRIQSFYVPLLGPAPRWVSFLDSITEELEEEQRSGAHASAVFDDYKFVTRDELTSLGMAHAIGTPLVRAHMHGFFLDARLYKKVKALSEPFAYEQYRKEKIRERVAERQGQRIVMKKKNALPAVNPKLAKRLLRAEKKKKRKGQKEDGEEREGEGEGKKGGIIDSRFAGMFEDSDFQIDERSEDFKRLYATGMSAGNGGGAGDDDDDASSDEEEEEEEELEPGTLRSGASAGFTVIEGKRSSESVLGKASLRNRKNKNARKRKEKEREERMREARKALGDAEDVDDDVDGSNGEGDEEEEQEEDDSDAPRMRVVGDDGAEEDGIAGLRLTDRQRAELQRKRARAELAPLGKRAAEQEARISRPQVGGSRSGLGDDDGGDFEGKSVASWKGGTLTIRVKTGNDKAAGDADEEKKIRTKRPGRKRGVGELNLVSSRRGWGQRGRGGGRGAKRGRR